MLDAEQKLRILNQRLIVSIIHPIVHPAENCTNFNKADIFIFTQCFLMMPLVLAFPSNVVKFIGHDSRFLSVS